MPTRTAPLCHRPEQGHSAGAWVSADWYGLKIGDGNAPGTTVSITLQSDGSPFKCATIRLRYELHMHIAARSKREGLRARLLRGGSNFQQLTYCSRQHRPMLSNRHRRGFLMFASGGLFTTAPAGSQYLACDESGAAAATTEPTGILGHTDNSDKIEFAVRSPS